MKENNASCHRATTQKMSGLVYPNDSWWIAVESLYCVAFSFPLYKVFVYMRSWGHHLTFNFKTWNLWFSQDFSAEIVLLLGFQFPDFLRASTRTRSKNPWAKWRETAAKQQTKLEGERRMGLEQTGHWKAGQTLQGVFNILILKGL